MTFDVVCGAGPVGRYVTEELVAAGRQVRVLTRSGRALPGTEGMAVDLTDPAATGRAFAGASVVYNCASPPYAEWAKLVPPLMNGIIGGALSAGVTVVYADNLYCYGPVDGMVTEDLPYRPRGAGATARARAAEALMAAGLPATIGRASDFFGPGVLTSFVGDRVFPQVLAGKPASVLPGPDTPHSYTYIQDFARSLVTLGSHRDALGEVWHVPNSEAVTTRRFVELVGAAAGTSATLKVLPKPLIAVLGLFNGTMRTIGDRLYQTEQPFVADHSKYAKAFGADPTALTEAIGATVEWYRRR